MCFEGGRRERHAENPASSVTTTAPVKRNRAPTIADRLNQDPFFVYVSLVSENTVEENARRGGFDRDLLVRVQHGWLHQEQAGTRRRVLAFKS